MERKKKRRREKITLVLNVLGKSVAIGTESEAGEAQILAISGAQLFF